MLNSVKSDIKVGDILISLYDLENSETLSHLMREVVLGDEYGIVNMQFNDDDVVIDIGANVGLVSIFLAKKFPNIKIYSFEAHPYNYKNFINNIEINKVKNIIPNNHAVYSIDNQEIEISMDFVNSGSSNCYEHGNLSLSEKVKTISLDTIINENNINKIKFLKIDCEGAEFDILENSQMIQKIEIENIGVEIHGFMKKFNKDVESLKELVNKISKEKPKIKIYG